MSTQEIAKQIRDWQADAVAWAEQVVHLRSPLTGAIEPLRLLDHQREWLRRATNRGPDGRFAHGVCVASWPKREGKSLVCSLLGVWRLSCFERQRIGIIANSEAQARSVLLDQIKEIVTHSPALRAQVPEECIQTNRVTVPGLDNAVSAYPANWRTVQGLGFDLLLADELHASEDGGKAFTFASQQTESVDAQTLISSQAGAPTNQNPLWRLYNAEEAHVFFDYRQEPVSPWSVSLAERAKNILLPGEYDYLWRNQWGQTGLKLVSSEDVQRACMPYRQPETREEWLKLWAELFPAKAPWFLGIGLDRAGVGRGGDRTVWTVVARFAPAEGEPFFRVLRQDVLPTGSEREVLEAYAETCAIFGGQFTGILFENFGCSDLVEKVPGATLEAPTSQRQNGLFTRLSRLFAEGRIGFPEELDLLKQEALNFEYDCESGAQTKFGTQRGHDDAVYSTAWSVAACDAPPAPEYETVYMEDVFPQYREPESAARIRRAYAGLR